MSILPALVIDVLPLKVSLSIFYTLLHTELARPSCDFVAKHVLYVVIIVVDS